MVDMFEKEICNYCKNNNCNKSITIKIEKNLSQYKCNEYVKNELKIVPYEKPLTVTAKRNYLIDKEL